MAAVYLHENNKCSWPYRESNGVPVLLWSPVVLKKDGAGLMKCNRCNREITEEESFTHLGETLCDDCYIDVLSPTKSCDPWAVYSATRTRESSGLTGIEGLTSLQQAIYAFVKNRGKVTAEEITTKFNLSQRDMQNQFATLRHCELIKGHKENDRVYIVPFESR